MGVRDVIASELTRIGVALGKPYGSAQLHVFADILAEQTTEQEFPAFVSAALKSRRWSRWQPALPEIQDALWEYRNGATMEKAALDAYERVLAAGDYSPEGGTVWSYRNIKARCGAAAAEAFLAAGGNAAFEVTYNADKRCERFVAGYKEALCEEIGMAPRLQDKPTDLLEDSE